MAKKQKVAAKIQSQMGTDWKIEISEKVYKIGFDFDDAEEV